MCKQSGCAPCRFCHKRVMDEDQRAARQGFGAALAAYTLWGTLPIYFRLVATLGPLEIVAHRVLWSCALLLAVVLASRRVAILWRHLTNRASVFALAASAALIAINWTVYVLAVNSGHILAASLGYFLNPLISVILGVVVLKERLRPAQAIAVAIAAAGAAVLAVSALNTLWISITLALSFAFYGLVRKSAPVDALTGVTIETLLLAPLALVYLVYLGEDAALGSGSGATLWALAILSGVITSVPLLMFGYAARQLPLSTIGLLQYIAPSMQFLIGLLVYREPLDGPRLTSFIVIWAGLAVFTWDAVRAGREGRARASA